jgi:hypothetical protein
MKTCPACQQTLGLHLRVCPYCGHRFMSATAWVLVMAIVFVVIAGVLLFQTRK